MTEKIKVSIIVPAYNVEGYLEECITSLIGQTYRNIEIIIINDGSKDNSKRIIEKYVVLDNRIIEIEQENMGANIARTNGIKKSTGDYLMFIDADDYILNNTIKELVEKIEFYNVDIIKFRFIDDKNIIQLEQKEKLYTNKQEIYEMLLTTTKLNNLTTEIINRSLFDLEEEVFKIKSSSGEDLQMNLEIYDKAQSILIIPNEYYYYRLNKNSTTNTVNKRTIYNNIEQTNYTYQNLFKYAKKWNLLNEQLTKRIVERTFKNIMNNIIKIIESTNLENEDHEKLDYIIENNEIINKAKKNINAIDLRLINKQIYKLILNRKYSRAKSILIIKKYINKLMHRR